MLQIDEKTALGLPVDQLGLMILKDFFENGGWNDRSYMLEMQQHRSFRDEGARAVAEAFGWLKARGLVATDFSQSSANAIFVTRTGRRVLEDGPDSFYATERLQQRLHPKIEAKARPQFLIGEYEQGVFAALKAVEVRVRKLGGFDRETIGVDLINKAFGPKGPLVDNEASKGEREGMRALFAGAYAVFRNPAGHHEVDYEDVAEAAEAVQTSSLLMRILDRIEER